MPNKSNKEKRKSKGPDFLEQPSSLRDTSRNPTCLISPQDLKEITAIGEGFYANVMLGKWLRPNRKEEFVAIKSIKNCIIDGHLEDILREADAMISLQHENIIRLYGISLVTSHSPMGVNLVTEYAVIGSLLQVLQSHDKPEFHQITRLWKFASQIANGMEYLAKQGLVHRDLAARNVLVVEPELVRISDFGLAKALDQGQAITPGREMAIAWCAPEIFKAEQIDHKCDVWSYAVLLWEMFSFGKTPWQGIPIIQVMKIVTSQPEKRLEQPKACPPNVYDLMISCWHQEPKQRPDFTDIKSVITTLEPVTGVAKEDLWASTQGRLSFPRHSTVTVISKSDVLPWTGQNEEGQVGLFDPNCVVFDKDAQTKLPKDIKRGSRLWISQPFNPTVKSTEQILDDMGIAQDDQVRKLIANQKKLRDEVPKDDRPQQHTPPRPEPMLREDPINGYMPMNDGIREEESKDDHLLRQQDPASDGELQAHADRENTRKAPPAVPERTDLNPRTAIKQSTPASGTHNRRRPVPTPRKERLKPTVSTPPVPLDVTISRVRSQSQPEPMYTRYEIDDGSFSDPECEHPSLVPLIGPSTSVPEPGSRFFAAEYNMLCDSGNSSEDEAAAARRADSFDNKGYATILYMDANNDDEAPNQEDDEGPIQNDEQHTLCFDNMDYYRMERFDEAATNAVASAETATRYLDGDSRGVGTIEPSTRLDLGSVEHAYGNVGEVDVGDHTYGNVDSSSGGVESAMREGARHSTVEHEDVAEPSGVYDSVYIGTEYYEDMAQNVMRAIEGDEEPPPLPDKVATIPRNKEEAGAAIAVEPSAETHAGGNTYTELASQDTGYYEQLTENSQCELTMGPMYESISGFEPTHENRINASGTTTDQNDRSFNVIDLNRSHENTTLPCQERVDFAPPPLPRKDLLTRDVSRDTSTLPRPLYPLSNHQTGPSLGPGMASAGGSSQTQTSQLPSSTGHVDLNRNELNGQSGIAGQYALHGPSQVPGMTSSGRQTHSRTSQQLRSIGLGDANWSAHPTKSKEADIIPPSIQQPGLAGSRIPHVSGPTRSGGTNSQHNMSHVDSYAFEARPVDTTQTEPHSEQLYDSPFPSLPPPPVIDPSILNQPPLGHRTATDVLMARLNLHSAPAENPNLDPEETGLIPDFISRHTPDATARDPWQELAGDDVRRQIHSELPHLSMGECETALLRYKSDVGKLIKVFKVCSLTGVDESEVEYHLCHCGWDVQRAVNYILDKMT